MRMDRFTVKSQEALQSAQELAKDAQHPEVSPEHLLMALLIQDGAPTPAIIRNVDADLNALKGGAQEALDKKARVQGLAAELYFSASTRRILDGAWREATDLQDAYMSTEHLLVATAKDKDSAAGKLLRKHGVTAEKILGALESVRGGQKVEDPNAEDLSLIHISEPTRPY